MSENERTPAVQRYRPDRLSRLITLSDVIFASAMTVMVLLIEVPEAGSLESYEQIESFMFGQLEHLGVYIVSFVLISIYWMRHLEHFSHYRETHTPHMWRQLGFLAAIVVIPFSSTFASSYPNNFAVEAFYSVNMVLVGVFSFAEWNYATTGHRLVDTDLDDATIREIRGGTLTEPIVALVALAVAWFNPGLWEPTFILAPILFSLQRRVRAWHARRRASR